MEQQKTTENNKLSKFMAACLKGLPIPIDIFITSIKKWQRLLRRVNLCVECLSLGTLLVKVHIGWAPF